MSDHDAESDDHDKDENLAKSLQPFQSAWMSHSTHAFFRPLDCEPGQICVHRSKPQNYLNHGSEIETGSSKFVKEFRELHKAVINEGSATSLTKLKHQTSPSSMADRFPMFKSSQNGDGVIPLKNPSGCDVSNKLLLSMHQFSPPRTQLQCIKSQVEPRDMISYSSQQVKSYELLQENNMDDPSRSNNRLRNFLGEHSDVKVFPDQYRLPEARLYRRPFELSRNPSSVHDMETMRICTTKGSVEEFRTTHHFLITKKTDVNLYGISDGQTFGKSTISTKFKGKSHTEPFSLSPDIGFNVKRGVKLQPLDSSTDSEARQSMQNILTSAVDLNKESSIEAGTMGTDSLRVNHLFGTASSISSKEVNAAQRSLTLEAATASVGEGRKGTQLNRDLPVIYQEATNIPESSTDDAEASSSRTQSLDVDNFLLNAEHPANSKCSACPDASAGLDPYSRWVKRLKPSSSDSFAHGTKILKMGEASSHEKINKLFNRILSASKSISEPKTDKSSGKRHVVADQTANSSRKVGFSSIDPVWKSAEITLSHAWIRRWCHNQVACSKKNSEAAVVNKVQSSKPDEDKNPKKQYPSIAAMALMGKAMNGFHPFEFRKRGSFVVWNTK